MKTLQAGALGLLVVSTILTAVAPAYALGGCGPNRHRNGWGQCVWGGQNQDWCIRKTGHPAQRMPDGTMRCFRY